MVSDRIPPGTDNLEICLNSDRFSLVHTTLSVAALTSGAVDSVKTISIGASIHIELSFMPALNITTETVSAPSIESTVPLKYHAKQHDYGYQDQNQVSIFHNASFRWGFSGHLRSERRGRNNLLRIDNPHERVIDDEEQIL